MKIKLLTDTAKMPTRADSGAAGYDVYADEIIVRDHEISGYEYVTVEIGLGFASEIPEGKAALLMPRSGLGTKQDFRLKNTIGLIDPGFIGEWMIKATCKPELAYSMEQGDRIAQFILIDAYTPELEQVEELTETERGDGGFGSTGK